MCILGEVSAFIPCFCDKEREESVSGIGAEGPSATPTSFPGFLKKRDPDIVHSALGYAAFHRLLVSRVNSVPFTSESAEKEVPS